MKNFYTFEGKDYPNYLKEWDAISWVLKFAEWFCDSKNPEKIGMDVGCGSSPLVGAIPIDQRFGDDAMSLPCKDNYLDYICSSHLLEHLENPLEALKHWYTKLKFGGILFLYLPHIEMTYWNPEYNKKHKYIWTVEEAKQLVINGGFKLITWSERDLYWSFSIVSLKEGGR
jgi:SAM-dependent methyltransferase